MARARALTAALAGFIVVGGVAWSAPSLADRPGPTTRAEARASFEEGARLFKAGDTRGALAAFRRAHALQPEPRVLFNVARLEETLGDDAAAYRDFAEFHAMAHGSAPAERLDEATRALRRLATRVGWIAVTSASREAVVEIDGAVVGRTPTRAVVAPGSHHLVVKITSGAEPDRRVLDETLDVEAGATRTEHVDMVVVESIPVDERLDAPVPPAKAASGPPHSVATASDAAKPAADAPAHTGTWLAWAATGALLAAAGTAGVLAYDRVQTYERARETLGVTRAELEARQSDARTLSVTTVALGGAAIVGAVIATVVTVSGPGERGAARADVALGPTYVGVAGSFW